MWNRKINGRNSSKHQSWLLMHGGKTGTTGATWRERVMCVCGVWAVLVSVTDAATLFWHHLCEHKDDISWLKMTSAADIFHCVYTFGTSFIILCVTRVSLSHVCVTLVCCTPPRACMPSSLSPSSCSLVVATLSINWREIKVYCSVMQSVPAVERWAGCPLRWADT